MEDSEPVSGPELTVEVLKSAAVEAKQIQAELQLLKVTVRIAQHPALHAALRTCC